MHFRRFLVVVAVLFVAYQFFFSSARSPEFSLHATSLPTSITISVCGDGAVSSGESCDDGFGNNTGAYASSTSERHCAADCFSFGPYCGDTVLQVRFSEGCDDGNNTSGDLCSAQCIPETPVAPPPPAPTLGGVPSASGPIGNILSELETKVVLRGKVFPNATVNILLDGAEFDTVRTDSNAEFFYSTNRAPAGAATFGFWAADSKENRTITTSVVFEVVQSAVTTVANILLPPSIALSSEQLAPGEFLTLSGETVPGGTVVTETRGTKLTTFSADAEGSGAWSLQVDTNSLGEGLHTVKPLVELPVNETSGYGRSLSFFIGDEPIAGITAPDVNDDGRINLVDFSIFLLSWGGEDDQFDFNRDGSINLADFSILLFNWTG